MKSKILLVENEKIKHDDSAVNLINYNTVKLTQIDLTKKSSLMLPNIKAGQYFIINFSMDAFSTIDLEDALTAALNKLGLNELKSILFAGLGNPLLIADSFGSTVCSGIEIHESNDRKVYAAQLPVEGLSGIDSLLHLNFLADLLKTELIIMFDSVSTDKASSLLCSIQVSDTPFDILAKKGDSDELMSALSNNYKIISIGYATCITEGSIIHKQQSKGKSSEEFSNTLFALVETDIYVKKIGKILSDCINKIIVRS